MCQGRGPQIHEGYQAPLRPPVLGGGPAGLRDVGRAGGHTTVALLCGVCLAALTEEQGPLDLIPAMRPRAGNEPLIVRTNARKELTTQAPRFGLSLPISLAEAADEDRAPSHCQRTLEPFKDGELCLSASVRGE